MAITKHDSLFKGVSLPNGISTRATKYKEMAAEGKQWQSPIFGIGSAKSSGSLPSAKKITRKSRNQGSRATLNGSKSSSAGRNAVGSDSSRGGDVSSTAYDSSQLNGSLNSSAAGKYTAGAGAVGDGKYNPSFDTTAIPSSYTATTVGESAVSGKYESDKSITTNVRG